MGVLSLSFETAHPHFITCSIQVAMLPERFGAERCRMARGQGSAEIQECSRLASTLWPLWYGPRSSS
jgi:hypothetical protein